MARRVRKTQSGHYRKTSTHCCALACLTAAAAAVNHSTPARATTITSTWTGTTSSAWTAPANWNPNTSYPNNGNAGISDYDALIPAVSTPDFTPAVNSNITIDSLMLNASASLAIQAGNTLQLNASFVNSGTVTVGSPSDTTASILSLGPITTTSGTGTITLDNPLAAITGSNFTLSTNINGEGTIANSFTNNGTIDANIGTNSVTPGTGTLLLQGSTITNNFAIESQRGGVLILQSNITQGINGAISSSEDPSAIQLDNVTVTDGKMGTISAPTTFQTFPGTTDTLNNINFDATINIVPNCTLTINGPATGHCSLIGAGLVTGNIGGGTVYPTQDVPLVLDGTVTSEKVMIGDTFQLGPNSGTSSITSLTFEPIGGGSLDLTNNTLLFDYTFGNDPISSIAALLKSGYNNGTWNGVGINSSTAAANSASYGLGYADSADPGNPAGLSSGTIEIKYTLLGDANLSGVVDGTDFGIVAANFNKGVSRWDQGDFNYDGTVDGSDFSDLAANFNQGAASPAARDALVSFAAANGLLADVPEPACAALLLVISLGILPRRRRTKMESPYPQSL